MDVVRKILSVLLLHLSKNALVSIIFLLAGVIYAQQSARSKERHKQEEARQQLILDSQITLGENQVILSENQVIMSDDVAHIKTDLSEVKSKQNIIINTIPEQDKKMINQVIEMYEEFRDGQSDRDGPSSSVHDLKKLAPIYADSVISQKKSLISILALSNGKANKF